MLLVMTFFPDSASSAALSATADVHGFDFDHAIERLTDLALLDAQQEDLNSTPRYTLHPLVRAFAGARLHEIPDFEKQARLRWTKYFLDFARHSIVREIPGERYWNSLVSRRVLQFVDPEWINLRSILAWVDQNKQDEFLVELMMVLVHYMDRRALYLERIDYARKAAAAARKLGRQEDEAWLQIDGLGWALIEENRFEEAIEEITVGLHVAHDIEARGLNANDWIVLAYAHLARMYLHHGEETEATSLVREAECIPCGLLVRSRVLLIAGELAQKKQAISQSINQLMEALKIIREYHDGEEFSEVRHRLGFAYLAGGDLEKAEAQFTELSDHDRQIGTIEALYGKYGLACIAQAKGDIENARRLAEESMETLSRLRTSHRLRKEIKEFLASIEIRD